MVTVDKVKEVLHWSDLFKYSLADFAKNCKLPQVVIVDIGYYGDTERCRIGRNEIITMHEVRTYRRVVGEDSDGKPITISLHCPAKVLIKPLPMLCPYGNLVIDQIQFVHASIKYFRVCNIFYDCENDTSVEVGTILERKQIHMVKQFVKFEIVATRVELKVMFGCKAIFEPLLDHQEYTLKEVKEKFGFPAALHFLKDDSEKRKKCSNKSTKFVKNLGNVTVLHDIVTDTRVIATTVVGPNEDKAYLELPKDIALQVRASNEYLLGEDCYIELVRKLHDEYDPTSVTEANVDKFEYLDETKDNLELAKFRRLVQQGQPPDQCAAFSRPELPKRNATVTSKPPSRPPKNLQRSSSTKASWTSAVARKAKKGIQNRKVMAGPPSSNPGNTECLSPGKRELPPRCNQGKTECTPHDNKLPPSSKQSSADRLPIHDKHAKSGSQASNEGSEPRYQKNRMLPSSQNYVTTTSSPPHDQANTLTPAETSDVKCLSQSSDQDYIWPEVQQGQAYTYMGNRKVGEQVDLYEAVDFYDDIEQDSDEAATTSVMYRNRPPPSLPELVTTNVTSKCETKSIVTLCRIPEDLSKLTVEDVGEVLKELGMDCYVSVFNKELIDGEMLMALDEDEMAALKMNSFHIKKMRKVLSGWRPNFNAT